VISSLIQSYCREAGVRSLQKHIEKILRKVAHKVVVDSKKNQKISILPENLKEYVGLPSFPSDKYYEVTKPGVVMGLAWTSMGGATLYVETIADRLVSKPEFHVTGQLGDVMKESTSIALAFAKYFLEQVSSGNKFFETASLHMHIPEGATPKDGPSAGVTMVTSLLSLALNKPIIQNVAMTGEITLMGKILSIGGVKEKTIAAKRSGVKTLLFPKDNKKDVEELPDYIKKGVTFHFAYYYEDIYKVVFENQTPESTNTKEKKIKKTTTKKK